MKPQNAISKTIGWFKGKILKQSEIESSADSSKKSDITTGFTGNLVSNPDKILSLKSASSNTERVYEEMLYKDPEIKQAMQTRVSSVIGKSWRVTPATDSERDKAIADFITHNLKNISFDSIRRALLKSGLMTGLGVAEIIYRLKTTKQFGTKYHIETLLDRKPWRFRWNKKNELRLLTANDKDGLPLAEYKMQTFTHEKQFENLYGEGLGKSLYWSYWFKKNAIKSWAIFGDKFGFPTVIGKYPVNTTQTDQEKLLDVIKAIQHETGIIIPDGQDIGLLDAIKSSSSGGGGVAVFSDFIKYFDEKIQKTILGQTLTSSTGSTGSFAQARVHNEVRGDLLKSDADSLSESFNRQLIKYLVDLNFADVDAYPEIWIDTTPPPDLETQIKIDAGVQKIGGKISKKHIADTYGFAQDLPDSDYIDSTVSVPPHSTTPAKPKSVAFAEQIKPTAVVADIRRQLLNRGVNATDDVVLNALDADPYREIRNLIIDEVGADRIPTADILSSGKHLEDILYRSILTARLNAVQSVVNDLRVTAQLGEIPAGFIPENSFIEFAETDYANSMFTPEEALAFFEQKTAMSFAEYQKLDAAAKAMAISIAGDQTGKVAEKMKQKIEEAIASGGATSPRGFADALNALLGAMGIEPIKNHQAETVLATNLHSAFNAGRWELYHRPEIKKIYTKYEYVTAGDDRVRPAHQAMDGIVRPADDPFWLEWYPPNGFRCRCTVLAISKYEDVPLSVVPSGFAPDKGFDTNPAAN